MEAILRKWEAAMQADPALNDRLQRLNPEGYPATRRGDLLSLAIKGEKKPVVVSWDGSTVKVERKQPKNPFLAWSIDAKKFKEIFLSGKFPPVLVAMNDDQKNIKDPLGMRGVRLEMNAFVVTGSASHLKNLTRSLEQAGTSPESFVVEPLACVVRGVEESWIGEGQSVVVLACRVLRTPGPDHELMSAR